MKALGFYVVRRQIPAERERGTRRKRESSPTRTFGKRSGQEL
jgi:hypothetical protein